MTTRLVHTPCPLPGWKPALSTHHLLHHFQTASKVDRRDGEAANLPHSPALVLNLLIYYLVCVKELGVCQPGLDCQSSGVNGVGDFAL
jgi:hypothetical protein